MRGKEKHVRQNKDTSRAGFSLENTHTQREHILLDGRKKKKKKAAANMDSHSQSSSFKNESQYIFRKTRGKKIQCQPPYLAVNTNGSASDQRTSCQIEAPIYT